MSEVFLKIKNQINILNLIIAEEKELLENNDYNGLLSLVEKKADCVKTINEINNSMKDSSLTKENSEYLNLSLSEAERANKVNALLVSGLLRVNREAINQLTGREQGQSYSKQGSSYEVSKNTLGEA